MCSGKSGSKHLFVFSAKLKINEFVSCYRSYVCYQRVITEKFNSRHYQGKRSSDPVISGWWVRMWPVGPPQPLINPSQYKTGIGRSIDELRTDIYQIPSWIMPPNVSLSLRYVITIPFQRPWGFFYGEKLFRVCF